MMRNWKLGNNLLGVNGKDGNMRRIAKQMMQRMTQKMTKSIVKQMGMACLMLFFAAVSVIYFKMPVMAAEEETKTITMTLERFSMGGDFIVEPTVVEFKQGESYAEVLTRVLNEKGISYSAVENSSYGFYLQGIDGVDCSSEKIPACVREILNDMEMKIGGNDKPGLYEFSYTSGSGWMFYIDNAYVPLSMGYSFPKDGEVVRFMFTLCYGADLTGTLDKSMTADGKDKVYYSTTDKTKLIQYMGQINRERARWEMVDDFAEAYQNALDVMANIKAARYEVNEALNWLKDLEKQLPPLPEQLLLNKEVLELTEGETAVLSYEFSPVETVDEITWSSDNTAAASVKNGVVTAVGEGTAHIYAKTPNGLEAMCTVTVKAIEAKKTFQSGAPTVTVKALSGTSVQVNWKAYANADRYLVYRKTAASSKWTSLAEVKDVLIYTDKTAKAGTTYYYTVKAQSNQWGSIVSSKYVTNVKIDTAQKVFQTGKPTLTGKALSYNSIKLSWNTYKNAEKYILYRRTGSGSWKKLKTVTGTSYTDKTALTGKVYSYKLTAQNSKWGQITSSKNSLIVKVKTTLGKAVIQKTTAGKKTATITWKKVSGASGYKIYRASSKNGSYQCIKTVKNNVTSYKNTSLKTGKTYYYKVRAYRTVEKNNVYGAYSTVKTVKVK